MCISKTLLGVVQYSPIVIKDTTFDLIEGLQERLFQMTQTKKEFT